MNTMVEQHSIACIANARQVKTDPENKLLSLLQAFISIFTVLELQLCPFHDSIVAAGTVDSIVAAGTVHPVSVVVPNYLFTIWSLLNWYCTLHDMKYFC